jgi:hypothetical protein
VYGSAAGAHRVMGRSVGLSRGGRALVNGLPLRQAVLADELCAVAGQPGLHDSRLDDFDHGAPPGQVPGDVERGGCGDEDPGTSVAELAVGVAVPPEVITQDRDESRADDDGRPGT